MKPRARDLGVPFEGSAGPLNAITDVAGVEAGHVTLISGEGPLRVSVGPVRTGVTAVFPRGRESVGSVFAGWFSLNGSGEMTGTAWIDESGLLDGPVVLTNTHSVGVARDAVIAWQVRNSRMPGPWSLPVVAETWDGGLNDGNGFHVRPEHVFQALDGARSGPVAEGSVGGGTGMVCYQYKGGIGTASRVTESGFTVGVLVQANHGLRRQLRIAGAPVGLDLEGEAAEFAKGASGNQEKPGAPAGLELEAETAGEEGRGSIIIVVATDAPLLPNQARALAKRAALGLARTGSVAAAGSGDLFLAFSTANLAGADPRQDAAVTMLGLSRITAVFEAVVQATEEAIVNALVAAETMAGINGRVVPALPHDKLVAILRRYNRLAT